MCQQWFSVAGLILDAIGVLMLVAEWRIAFRRDAEERKAEIAAMNHRWFNKQSELADEEPDESPAVGRGMWATLTGEVRRRSTLVFIGIALIIVGFIGQVLGSWPYGVPFLGWKSC